MPDYSSILPQTLIASRAAAKDVMPAQEQLQNELEKRPLQKTSIQFKLTIGIPDDPLEHEADAMADIIMRMPEQNFIQRKCARCEEEEKVQRKPLASFIQRKEASSNLVASDAISSQINSSRGNGSNMDRPTQSFMESRFGTDFSNVKIHTGNESVQMNRELNAKAFTVGNDIYFNEGQYNPVSGEGKHLLAHELTHTVQQGASDCCIQRTPASTAIIPLISYSTFDLVVTDAEETSVISILRTDTDVSATITDIATAGMLDELFDRVDSDINRRALLQILGANLNVAAFALVEPILQSLDRGWQLQFYLGREGVTTAAPAFSRSSYSSLISSDPSASFTGSGATGINPSTRDVPSIDEGLLAIDDPATVARYSNPLAAGLVLPAAADRTRQAELLVNQPISTVYEDSYAGSIPSRAQIMRAAAIEYNLTPQVIAAFILTEQRDQSGLEDAKDYESATSYWFQYNASIGLGQVVISTATRNDLFSSLLPAATRTGLEHNDIALLLASDEFNIFAVANYIRIIADQGARTPAALLPNTFGAFPGLVLADYSGNASAWSDDNIAALGMYYTSRAWTDDLRSEGWGRFVLESYHDVQASGVF